jgi:hypothetical protein
MCGEIKDNIYKFLLKYRQRIVVFLFSSDFFHSLEYKKGEFGLGEWGKEMIGIWRMGKRKRWVGRCFSGWMID